MCKTQFRCRQTFAIKVQIFMSSANRKLGIIVSLSFHCHTRIPGYQDTRLSGHQAFRGRYAEYTIDTISTI